VSILLTQQSAGGDVTVALTGVSATASPGSVTTSRTVATTGVTTTPAVGTLGVSNTPALAGIPATSAPGSFSVNEVDVFVALTTIEGAGSAGTPVATATTAIAGEAATASVGSVVPTPLIPLTTVEATGGVGSVVQSADIPLTTVAGTEALGAFVQDRTIPLAGVAPTGAVGNILPVQNLTLALTGVDAAGRVGDVSAPGYLLLESGDNILLEDGESRLAMESYDIPFTCINFSAVAGIAEPGCAIPGNNTGARQLFDATTALGGAWGDGALGKKKRKRTKRTVQQIIHDIAQRHRGQAAEQELLEELVAHGIELKPEHRLSLRQQIDEEELLLLL
jgi:hypothetical protein